MKKLLFLSLIFLAGCSSAEDTRQISSPTSPEKVILALGDSLTAGLGVPPTDSYPSQLEAVLTAAGYSYRVQNAGVSGDTTAGLLSRLDWILGEAESNPQKYALAILCIGANDAFQGKSVEDIESNIRTIIERLQSKNIPILFAGMKAPLNLGGEYGRKYETIFPRLAKEYELVYMDFFLDGVALKAQYNQDDRIHPTREGYAIVADNLLEILIDEDMIRRP